MNSTKITFRLAIQVELLDGSKKEVEFDANANVRTVISFLRNYSDNTPRSKSSVYNQSRSGSFTAVANDRAFNTFAAKIPNANDAQLLISRNN